MSIAKSQPESQPESQSHTDFLVGIASENVSLKIRIKQEYDNSCAISHQINKLSREIDSCRRDLLKLNEFSEVRAIELKRFEVDLETSHSSGERIRNNIDFLRKQEEQIIVEEDRKKKERNLVAVKYENMILNQRRINASQPVMLMRCEMLNQLYCFKIHLGMLKKEVDMWQRKKYQMGKRLNQAVINLAGIFSKKTVLLKKKLILLNQLENEEMQVQRFFELTKKEENNSIERNIAQTPMDTNTFDYGSMDSTQFSSDIRKCLHVLPEKLNDQCDLMKHFQQVTAFKTSNVSFVSLKKFFQPSSLQNNLPQKILVSSNQKYPSARFEVKRTPVVQLITTRNKHDKEFAAGTDTCKNSTSFVSENEINLPALDVNLTEPENNATLPEDISNELNAEETAINSKNDVPQPTCVSSLELTKNYCDMNPGHCIPPSSKSNCSTPASVKSVSSQNKIPASPRSHSSGRESMHQRNTSRISIRLSPIARSQSPKISSKRSFGQIGLRTPYRFPDIFAKMIKGKQQLLSDKKLNESGPKFPKHAKIELISNSSAMVSKSKELEFEDIDAPHKSDDENGNKKSNKKRRDRLRKMSETKISSHEVENSFQSFTKDVSTKVQNYSKYFANAVQQRNNTTTTDHDTALSFAENYQPNNGKECIFFVQNTFKPNSNGSNKSSSHFSNATIQPTDEIVSSNSPLSNFALPFTTSDKNNIFGFSMPDKNLEFVSSVESVPKKNITNNGFPFNITSGTSQRKFSLF